MLPSKLEANPNFLTTFCDKTPDSQTSTSKIIGSVSLGSLISLNASLSSKTTSYLPESEQWTYQRHLQGVFFPFLKMILSDGAILNLELVNLVAKSVDRISFTLLVESPTNSPRKLFGRGLRNKSSFS